MATSIFKAIGDQLADFVDWAREQLADDLIRRSIAEDLGLEPGEAVPKADLPQASLDGVARYRSQANPDREAFVVLLNDVKAVYEACRAFISAFGVSDATVLNEVVYRLFDLLALNYMRLARPNEYFLFQALGAIVQAAAEFRDDLAPPGEDDVPPVVDVSRIDTDDLTIPRVFDTLAYAAAFALSPLYYIFEAFSAADEAAARRVSDRIFPHIAAALVFAGLTDELIYGWDRFEGGGQPLADRIAERMLSFAFARSGEPTEGSALGGAATMTLAIIPGGRKQASGLLLGVGGNVEMEVELSSRWAFRLAASAQPAFSIFLDTRLGNLGGHNLTNAPLNLALVSQPDEQNITYAIPDGEGTRLEIGQLAFGLSFNGATGQISAHARRCALVIVAEDQDGLLAKLLPSGGLRVPFDFGLGFSSERRFFTEGGVRWPTDAGPLGAPAAGDGPLLLGAGEAEANAALGGAGQPELGTQQLIPIGKTLGGLSVAHLLLALAPAQDPAAARATAEVSVALTARIGPVSATIERLGVEFGLAFPRGGGNAGFLDLGLGLRAPGGVGIKVESPIVTGGGFLALDRERGQYAGMLQLSIHETLVVTAIGLVTTRLPGGARGFAFVALITAEGFRPIPLGLGFTLTGLGGLVALNRTVDEEYLRAGLKSRALDDILFPSDPLRNAAQIFTTLGRAFPAREGSHLVGLVAQIRWGSPPILTMELGLVLELGGRTRLVILGRVAAIMPSEANDLLRLQMNALGVIDFDQKSLALDATLYDSRLAGRFPITGSMALRLRWGAAPTFAMAVGGFHPAFRPPAGFPILERLAISFSNTGSFRLRAETYFALTANTLQFGARAELFARAGSFSVAGAIAFDVLIQRDPFAFRADFYAALQLKRGAHNLFKVKLEGSLAGPRPLRIRGKASFEIFWCDFSVKFDQTLVAGEPPPRLAPVLVLARLRAALSDRRSWSGQLAAGERRVAALREPAAGPLVLHPLGALAVKQNVVPLDLEIAHFGGAAPADGQAFRITGLSVNGQSMPFERVADFFAPAQFLDLTEDEQLAAPAFELMPAGVAAGHGGVRFTADDRDLLEEPAIRYETKIIGRGAARAAAPFTPSLAALDRQLALGPAAQSELRRARPGAFQAAGAALAGRRWAVVSVADGSPQSLPGLPEGIAVSYAEAFQALKQLRQQDPARARGLLLARLPAPQLDQLPR